MRPSDPSVSAPRPRAGWWSRLHPSLRGVVLGPLLLLGAVVAALTLFVTALAAGDVPDGSGVDRFETVLFLGGLLLFVLGAVTTTVGATWAVVRAPARRDAAARRIEEQRRLAVTPALARRVQRLGDPRRRWRWSLRLGWVLPAVVAGVLLIGDDPPTPVLLVLMATQTGLVALGLQRWHQRLGSLRQDLRERYGLADTGDDLPLLQARQAEMGAFAGARGLTCTTGAPLGPEPFVVVSGTWEGMPFRMTDRVRLVELSRGDDGPEARTSHHLLSGGTAVSVDFVASIRLAVVRDSITDTLAWSHVGERVALESGGFEAAFDVYCSDGYLARLVLNPAVMDRLLARPGSLRLVIDHGELTVAVPDQLVPVDELDALVRLTVEIARSAKAAVVR